MDTQLNWSRNSILDINSDVYVVNQGTASVSNNNLTLGANSSVSYQYYYGSSQKLIRTNKLRNLLSVYCNDKDLLTRYNNNLEVNIKIQYYDAKEDTSGNVTDFTDGIYDTFNIYPYLTSEYEGYTNEFIIEIQNLYIKTITITFINRLDQQVSFQLPRVYPSLDLEASIKEIGITGSAEPIASMQLYDDEVVIWYQNETMPAFVKITEQAKNIYLFNVSDRYNFGVTDNPGQQGPYGRT